MKKIEKYKFGEMVIGEKTYKNDLIITPKKIVNNWWREKGHFLQRADLEKVMEEIRDVSNILIGCGYHNLMKIDPDLITWLKAKSITFFHGNSRIVVEQYNQNIEENKDCIAMFHLSC